MWIESQSLPGAFQDDQPHPTQTVPVLCIIQLIDKEGWSYHLHVFRSMYRVYQK